MRLFRRRPGSPISPRPAGCSRAGSTCITFGSSIGLPTNRRAPSGNATGAPCANGQRHHALAGLDRWSRACRGARRRPSPPPPRRRRHRRRRRVMVGFSARGLQLRDARADAARGGAPFIRRGSAWWALARINSGSPSGRWAGTSRCSSPADSPLVTLGHERGTRHPEHARAGSGPPLRGGEVDAHQRRPGRGEAWNRAPGAISQPSSCMAWAGARCRRRCRPAEQAARLGGEAATWARASSTESCPARVQQALHAFGVPSQQAMLQAVSQRQLRHRGRGQRGEQFASIRRSTARRRGDVTDAPARREDLGEAETLLRCQLERVRRRRGAQVRRGEMGVGVVLDDGEVVRLGELEHRGAPTAAQRCPVGLCSTETVT